MRVPLIALTALTALTAAAGVLLLVPSIAAQGRTTPQAPPPLSGVLGANRPKTLDARPFERRDLSGIWAADKYEFNAAAGPEFTPAGKQRFDANRPSYGPRAVAPAVGNDYVGTCNPQGLMRNLVYMIAPTEMIQTPDRILQRFEWTWDHREIWMDGRRLPDSVNDYLPRFNGYSVGRWEGDTLVVDTVGLDDRQWVDHLGYPISSQARLQERWTRTSYSTVTLSMTLVDPMLYVKPWESALITYQLTPKEDTALSGWAGLLEDRCIPLDEIEQFNTRVRNPAAGIR